MKLLCSASLRCPRFILGGILAFGLNAGFFLSATTAKASDIEVWLTGPEMTSNRNYRFSFDAALGQTYPIEVSSDLVHWSPLRNVSGQGVSMVVEDENASNFENRFYHIGVHPQPVTNMVFIMPGTFTMGSPSSEAGRSSIEGPQTVVTLTRGFWMGKYEVIQQDYQSVTGEGPASAFVGAKLPVDFATWSYATNYCQRLTSIEKTAGRLPDGFIYRLPTEAEWEYASRAGTTTPFGIGNGTSLSSTQANFDGNFPAGGAPTGPYLQRTTFGGTYGANAWGLCDMHGNVWEWCQDVYGPYPGGNVIDPKGPATGSTRVLRGGGFNSVGNACRSAKRDSHGPTYANYGLGFRVVLAHDP